MNERLKTVRNAAQGLTILLVTPVFILVLPPYVATHIRTASCLMIATGALAYALLWYHAAILLMDAAGSIYPVKRPFFDLGWFPRPSWHHLPEKNFGNYVASALISYFLTIYGFAVLYAAISALRPLAFSNYIGFFSAMYYAIVTAATVGFGDITPTSPLARLATSLEIIVAFFYAIFIFAAVVGHVVSPDSRRS